MPIQYPGPTNSSLTINKSQGQNQYYEENLGDRCRPLEMMRIPAGSFLMGSPEDELERSPNEGPQHQVTLARFFMSRHPITQAQWRVVAAVPQVNRELDFDLSEFKGERLPVEGFPGTRRWSFAIALPSTPIVNTAYPAKPSGNTPVVRVQRRPFTLVRLSLLT